LLAVGGGPPTATERDLLSECGLGSDVRFVGTVDDATLAALLAEVDDPGLQGKVLRLAGAAAAADRHLADAEDLVVAAARRHWPVAASPMPSAAPAAALQPL
jgi:hypothetical protein